MDPYDERVDAPTGDEVTPQEAPDEGTDTGVPPAVPGEQGDWVEQQPAQVGGTATGFDPDRPVRTSPPMPHEQSGVPALEGGGNEGVEPQEEFRGPVDPATP